MKKRTMRKFFSFILFLALLFSMYSALALNPSGMRMVRWSDPDQLNYFSYNMNFCAIDSATKQVIEDDAFSLRMKSSGTESYIGLSMDEVQSYSWKYDRGVFKGVRWRVGSNKYIVNVERVPKDYRIPTGYGYYDIKQDYSGIPSEVKTGIKVVTGILKWFPGVKYVVKAAEFLVKTGVPTQMINKGDFTSSIETTSVDWYAPWNCYKWIQVELQKKYAQSVSFIVPEYDESNPETVPHVYDASGEEYSVVYVGTSEVNQGEGRAYPKFTVGTNQSGKVVPAKLTVGKYTMTYKGETYDFSIESVQMPRQADGTSDVAAYQKLSDIEKQVIDRYGCSGYYTSSGQKITSPLDNDWTLCDGSDGDYSLHTMDETEAMNHVLVLASKSGSKFVLAEPEVFVNITVKYDNEPYANEEKLRFFKANTENGNVSFSYLGSATGEKADAYVETFSLTGGEASKTYKKDDTTGIYNLLKKGSKNVGIELVSDQYFWYTENSVIDEQRNTLTRNYDCHIDPNATLKSLTFYPVDENEYPVSRKYYTTSMSSTAAEWKTMKDPFIFTLKDLSNGSVRYLMSDSAERLQYTISLESSREYQLQLCNCFENDYKTDSAVWTIKTDTDGGVESFTPEVTTQDTGRAKLESNGEYSVMLLFREKMEVTLQKEWVDILGNTISREEEPADYIAAVLTDTFTGVEYRFDLRQDRNWVSSSCIVNASDLHGYRLTIEAVTQNGEVITSASCWDDLYSPLTGLQYSNESRPSYSNGIIGFIPRKGHACTVWLRNVRQELCFYKTNGITYVSDYHFKLEGIALTETAETIDGVPATKYTIDLSSLNLRKLEYELTEYDSSWNEIGYWPVQYKNRIFCFESMYYRSNPYLTVKVDGSGLRTNVELASADGKTIVLNLLDNGVRRNGKDTYKVTIQKHWSDDLSQNVKSADVVIEPYALGTTLSEPLTVLGDIGTSSAEQVITLSAENGWSSDVYLRKGVVYYVYEDSITMMDGASPARYSTEYYFLKQNAQQTRTDSWTATFSGTSEAEIFGKGEGAIEGALICEENGNIKENSYKQDILHLYNSTDNFTTFCAVINVEKGESAQEYNTPRNLWAVLQQWDESAGQWVTKTQHRILQMETPHTEYFNNLQADGQYRVRLRYEDEQYGIAENNCIIGSQRTYLVPKEQISGTDKKQALYSLGYDDTFNDLNNTQYISLSTAGNLRVYVYFKDGDNAGGKRPSSLSYQITRAKAGEEPSAFGCGGVLTKLNNEKNIVGIYPYEPTQYSYQVLLDGTFSKNGLLYLQTGNSPVYKVTTEGSVEQGFVRFTLSEQKTLTVRKDWNIDEEDLDRPAIVSAVLQDYTKNGFRTYVWTDAQRIELSEENGWELQIYTDKYRWGSNTEEAVFRVCELDCNDKVVEENGFVTWTIPEKKNRAGETISEHATMYRVNYATTVEGDDVRITNTAVMEQTLKKYWQLPNTVSKMNFTVLGLYAKLEGTADVPTPSRSVCKGGVKVKNNLYGYAVLKNSNNWSATFIADKYDVNGKKWIYSAGEVCKSALPEGVTADDILEALKLTEQQIADYKAKIENYVCISGESFNAFNNTEEIIPAVNIAGRPVGNDELIVYKVWDDGIDHSGQSIEVTLSYQGVEQGTQTLNADNNWSYTYKNLGGSLDDYQVAENSVPDGYYAEYISYLGGSVRFIINHPVGQATVKLTKEWDEDTVVQPASVTFAIERGVWKDSVLSPLETVTSVTLDSSTGWTKEIYLPARDAQGNRYEYSVTETHIDNDKSLVSRFTQEIEEDYYEEDSNAFYYFSCLNRSVDGEQITINVEKIWTDNTGEYQEPVTMHLRAYNNNTLAYETVKTFTLSREDGWATTFTMPKNDYLGTKVEYELNEEPPKGYDAGITRIETSETQLDFTVKNKSTTKHVILEYIGDGDGSTRPKNVTVRLQKQKDDGQWEDVIKDNKPVEVIMPDSEADITDEERQDSFIAEFGNLEINVNYRVRVCYQKTETETDVLTDDAPLIVKNDALASYQVESASKGYQVTYSEIANDENFPVQVISMNKLLDVEVQWLDNHNSGKTRPEALPLSFMKADADGENWVETGHTDQVAGWKDDSGSGIFVLNKANGYSCGTTGRVKVTGEEKKEKRILWKASNGTWYTVIYEKSDDPYLEKITLTEQKLFTVQKKWDIDILNLDKPDEIEVRLETWEDSSESKKDDDEDEPDGTEVETITLSAADIKDNIEWCADFAPVDRYKMTTETDKDEKETITYTEINYRVREVYDETVLSVKTGKKIVVKPGKDATFHVDTYYHPDGEEEKEHDTCYIVTYETDKDTTIITNKAVLDITIKKFWVMLGDAKKPDSVYLVLASRYKESYRDIVKDIPGIGNFVSTYTPMVNPISGDMVQILGKSVPVTIGKATEDSDISKSWTVSFRIKKYGVFGIPMEFKAEELATAVEDTIFSWITKLGLPVGYNPIKGFISVPSKVYMLTDTWGIGIVVNAWAKGKGESDTERMICGVKCWNDNNSSNRPKSITVHIKNKKTGAVVKTLTVTAATDWTWYWDKASKSETYTVEEEVPAGYTVEYDTSIVNGVERWLIINTLRTVGSDSMTEYTVRKVWKDSKDHSADSVHVRLNIGGAEIASADLNADNHWSFTFTNLPKGLYYSVSEDKVSGYKARYERVSGGTVIYNTPVDDSTLKLVIKKVWKNIPDEKIPDTLTMQVLQNGLKIRTVTLEKSKNWTLEITEDEDGNPLRKENALGTACRYSLREPDVPENCTFSVSSQTSSDGNTINLTGVNSYHDSETVTLLTIRKVWNENPVKEHDAVTVTLKANGTEADVIGLSEGENWSVTRLYPLQDNQGGTIEYTVEEAPVYGYEATYSYDKSTHTLTVTNTPWAASASTITVSNTIDTENGGNADREFHFTFNIKDENGKQLSGATICLQKKANRELGVAPLTEDGYSFTLSDGETLLIMDIPEGSIYSIVEIPTIDERNAYNSEVEINQPAVMTPKLPKNTLSAVNSEKPSTITAAGSKRAENDKIDFYQNMETTDITVTKVWEDGGSDPVSFVLYRNGTKYDEYPNPTRSANSYTFSKLPKFVDTGSELLPNVWSVTEKAVDGYWAIYSNISPYADNTDRLYDGGTVYNRPYISFRFEKIWSGGNGGTITLVATEQGGTTYTRKVKTTQGKGTYSIYLPKYIGGRNAEYTVVEIADNDVVVTYQNSDEHASETERLYYGGTLINTVVPKTGDEQMPLVYIFGAAGALCMIMILFAVKRKAKKQQ